MKTTRGHWGWVVGVFFAGLAALCAGRSWGEGTAPSASGVASAGTGQGTAQVGILRGVTIEQRLNAPVPLDIVMTDEAGSRATLGALMHGRPVVLVLVQYRCPSLCTTILNEMLSTLKVIPQGIGKEYDVWTVSFDPQEDASLAMEKKRGYVQSYLRTRPEAVNATGGWHFLTGDAENIRRLTEAVGFHYRWDEPTQQYIHPAGLMMLTPEGKISRYFFGVDYEPLDLRLSLVEASEGRIGKFTDRALLFCYHYDPATGKYGLAIVNLLKAGGALTVVALGLGLWWLWRVDRRRTRRLMAELRLKAAPDEGGGP